METIERSSLIARQCVGCVGAVKTNCRGRMRATEARETIQFTGELRVYHALNERERRHPGEEIERVEVQRWRDQVPAYCCKGRGSRLLKCSGQSSRDWFPPCCRFGHTWHSGGYSAILRRRLQDAGIYGFCGGEYSPEKGEKEAPRSEVVITICTASERLAV